MLIPVLEVTPIVPSFPQESHSVHSPFLLGGVESLTKFSKMGLDRTLTLRRGLLEKREQLFSGSGVRGGGGGGGINFFKKR